MQPKWCGSASKARVVIVVVLIAGGRAGECEGSLGMA